MKFKQKTLFFSIIIILVLGGLVTLITFSPARKSSGKYDAFTTCLKDKGAVFYGAFWCSHCNATKKGFGTSATLLPYVECSTEDMQDQTQVCKDKKIEGYPTWEFADGSRLVGEQSKEALAEKTSCELPQ
ncbi:MAG TPA: thioredoxin domain-containing protein [Candidatus Paceibacterota bacterium]|nr:thioredoxin domain-containing protein [Candidatus Paceibacterota bacterium]HPT18353.1 thioredoxin domain-containing protein [Candidatus Paceibacterota bacterium]